MQQQQLISQHILIKLHGKLFFSLHQLLWVCHVPDRVLEIIWDKELIKWVVLLLIHYQLSLLQKASLPPRGGGGGGGGGVTRHMAMHQCPKTSKGCIFQTYGVKKNFHSPHDWLCTSVQKTSKGCIFQTYSTFKKKLKKGVLFLRVVLQVWCYFGVQMWHDVIRYLGSILEVDGCGVGSTFVCEWPPPPPRGGGACPHTLTFPFFLIYCARRHTKSLIYNSWGSPDSWTLFYKTITIKKTLVT